MAIFEDGFMEAAKKALETKRQSEIKDGQTVVNLDNSDVSSLLENSVKEYENLAREKEKREQIRIEFIALARELSELQERLPFTGVDSDGYSKIKATDDEFPGYAMPIDELIAQFKKEGMKIVFGTDPMGSNVLIMPFEMADDEYNGIQPEHLKLDVDMDERLKKLILLRRDYPRQG